MVECDHKLAEVLWRSIVDGVINMTTRKQNEWMRDYDPVELANNIVNSMKLDDCLLF